MPTEKTFRNFVGMEFVRIPRKGSCGGPGTFEMGFEGGELVDEILSATERGGRDIRLSLFGKK